MINAKNARTGLVLVCAESVNSIIFLNFSQDKHVKEQQINHWKKIIAIQEQLKTNQVSISQSFNACNLQPQQNKLMHFESIAW